MNLFEIIRYKIDGLRFIPHISQNLLEAFEGGPLSEDELNATIAEHGLEDAKASANYHARTYVGWMLSELGLWFLDWNPGPEKEAPELDALVYEMMSSWEKKVMYKTRQKIFDIAYLGLASQNWELSRTPQMCMYRGPNGTKCAIGHCIPDELYEPEFEGCTIYSNNKLQRVAGISDDDLSWSRNLQRLHDNTGVGRLLVVSKFPKTLKEAMEIFAQESGLTVPEIKD